MKHAFKNMVQRYLTIKNQIEKLQLKHSPQLIAVSKGHPIQAIETLYELGHRDFGESYLQELQQKQQLLKTLPITWHFIGNVQSNKTNAIASIADWVYSVDRIIIAKRLSQACVMHNKSLQVCIAINVNNEPNKTGITCNAIMPLAEQIAMLPNLDLRGIMAIPKKTMHVSERAETFAILEEQWRNVQQHFPTVDTLSVGMSNDWEAALQSGATCLRIGTAIFGPRMVI